MRRLFWLVTAVAICSCRVERPPYGGDKELALANATLAVDPVAVEKLLESGANPNAMVTIQADYQSAWFLALHELRPGRPQMVAIIDGMLKAGADPERAWGNPSVDPKKPPESKWHRFVRGGRIGGSSDFPPVELMWHPVPEVVRALLSAGLEPEHAVNALVDAVQGGDTEVVHMLVEAGTDVNCRSSYGNPLLAAIESRNMVLMTYLEEHGAREKP